MPPFLTRGMGHAPFMTRGGGVPLFLTRGMEHAPFMTRGGGRAPLYDTWRGACPPRR